MPAGEALAPWAVPLHNVIFIGFFPESEVGGMTFFGVFFHSCAGFFFLYRLTGKLAVRGKFRYVEINTVAYFVCVSLFEQTFDKFYHFGYVVGGFGDNFGLVYIERSDVLKEYARKIFRDFPRAFLLFARGFLHLVFSFVSVGKKMSHVGNVHHAFDFPAVVAKNPANEVHKYVRAQIADMSVAVYGRSAGIHSYELVFNR